MAVKDTTDNTDTPIESIPDVLPLIPLRDVVIYPYMIFPVLVGREASIAAVSKAIDGDKFVLVCTQRDPHEEDPAPEQLYRHGTVAKILQVLKLPNGLLKVLVDGVASARVEKFTQGKDHSTTAKVTLIEPTFRTGPKLEALMRQLDTLFAEYVRLHRSVPSETTIAYDSFGEPLRKAYYVAANLIAKIHVKQSILEIETFDALVYQLMEILRHEIDVMKIEVEIDDKVHSTIQKSQRKYFIQEQIRLLQKELGEEGDDFGTEYGEVARKLADAPLPEEVRVKATEEFEKLKRMSPMSPEATVSRNYLDWIIAMPWGTFTTDNLSLTNAEQVLNEDHYGLEKPKQRILEHIAVLNLVRDMKGQILCFVGPPGVGKTSLGKSIARALDRKFTRISLGGVHDESEIRGHRRTYIGSMPGRIIQAVRKAGTINPVILLDEIDKMSSDFHGDPASAMLEVLDPEQNHTFNDHYLDVDFDLSKVMFITTANVRYGIPLPLQDRMEIIELPGYLEHDKLEIAKRHLLPKQIAQHGLAARRVRFHDAAIRRIIREYTLESGVRNLEREIANVLRKTAKEVVMEGSPARGKAKGIPITPEKVGEYLGVPKQRQKKLTEGRVGSIVGLAWTSVGGDILHVDVTIMDGIEKLTLTGQLGDVMKESAHAAWSYLRSHAARFGFAPAFHEKKEVHVHLPEGAIPKDGPSAGLALALAMYSAVRGIAPRGGIAMTGEITLHGEVLPIGGLSEKLLAAQRYGIGTVLLPKANEPDLRDVPEKILRELRIIGVETVEEALALAFPEPSRSRRSR
jgi:ATP-dependent Lon protease